MMKKIRQEKKEKNKFLLILLLLLTFGVGLGYAVLSERLSINNTINYGTMKWNVGFTEAANNGGTITASPSVSSDKKTVTVACDLGTSTKSETCIAKVTVKNDSTFSITLNGNPTITFDETYINSVDVTWVDNNANVIATNSVIDAGGLREVQIKITTKTLTDDLLPSSPLSIPVTITMDWIEGEPVDVTIPEGTTVVGESLYAGNRLLNSVYIPVSVETIKASAFDDCINLSTIELPSGLKEIGNYAFRNCKKLALITIPSSVEFIGSGAFTGASVTTVEFEGTTEQWNSIRKGTRIFGNNSVTIRCNDGDVKL